MNNQILIICTVFFLLGCDDAGVKPQQHLTAQTDKTTYAIGESIFVSLQASYGSAYFWHCNNRIALAFERRQPDQQWPPPGEIGLLCLAYYPQGIIELTPNNVIHQSVTSSSRPAGSYRLRLVFGWDRDNVSRESIVSNEFVVQ